jgi:hypothetical protein
MLASTDSRVPQFEFLKPYVIPHWLHEPSEETEEEMKKEAYDAINLIDRCRNDLANVQFEGWESFDKRLSSMRDMLSTQINDYEETIR